MDTNETFYLTTPIFYPNAKLHMGHAYTTTLSDCIVRYHRDVLGQETYFLTGSDENTQKMVDAAVKEGKEPLDFLDEIVGKFASLFGELNISYDQFIRTTDQKRHWPGAQEIWSRLVKSDDIYKKSYEGLYCVGHEAFVTEKDLIDGKCPDHGTVPQFLSEENYFFKLSRYTEEIKRLIETEELRIVPATRKAEIMALLNEGLQDVSFSRPHRAEWPEGLGIPVPGDDTQVMYVWCDALTNYITALGYGRTDDALYQTFWPGMHVIGKDILRFHAAIWPGMLLSAGLPLPKTLLVHGFITSGGKKMGKSLGNVIDPEELLQEYGTDAVRYYLLRHVSPFEDGDITRESFKDAYNSGLANGLGNLSSRIMQLAQTHLEIGIRPEPREIPTNFAEAFVDLDIKRAADIVWDEIQFLDRKITESAPFKVVKTDPVAGKELIFTLTQDLYRIAELLVPFLPETAEKIKMAVIENKKPENLFVRKE